ncbi:MAG: RcpC/CpaB family pilus assembly protein [Dehalococcoidia bacterium]
MDSSVATVPVVVAEADIPVRDEILPSRCSACITFLSPRSAPMSSMTPRRRKPWADSARYPIARGGKVGRTRLVGAPEVPAISFQVRPACAASIPSVRPATSSLIAPGDFVDIMVAGLAKELVGPGILDRQGTNVQTTAPLTGVSPDAEIVVTVLQNVQVLAVERSFVANGVTYDPTTRGAPPASGFGTVTLALKPDQTQLMWLARQHGKMTLSLRRFGENEPTNLQPLSGPQQGTAKP